MKTSFKAVRAVFLAVFVFMIAFEAGAQRVRLKQLERYLGKPIPNRAGYVGLTDTLGDQYYHKLDSIIGYIADSISQGLDTDEQYFDTAMIVNDTLILSIIRDGLPAHRISLTAYTSDDQTLSYDHANNTLSISGGNSVTNFEQAWMRQADLLHPISNGESVLRSGYTTLGYNGSSVPLSFDSVQLRVWNESRIDWLGFTTSKPNVGQHRRIEINELANVLYLANKRFYATDDGADLFTNSTLFNGEFGTPYGLASSSTKVIEVDFTQGLEKLTSAGITYPQGNVYVSFYYVYNDATITVEAVTTGGTYNLSSTEKNIAISSWAGYKVLRYTIPQINYLTKLRFTFNTGAGNCWPTELSYVMSNYANEIEEPFVNKAVDNKLHTKLTFRDKVGDRQGDNGTLGQILMSKVDSVEWADFSAIPGIYTYITNISDSVATTADTDTDEQYFDSIAIVDDTLNVSIIRDGVPLIRIDLKPYLDDTDTDDQYFDVINITDDTLNLSIFDDGLPTHRLDLKPYLDLEENTDIQYIDTLYFDMDTLYISLIRDGVEPQKVYLGDLISMADSDKQRHDTAFIENNIIYLSLQRDSIPAHQLDLTPYLDDTDDQTVDTFNIVSNILYLSLEDDGEAAHTVDLSPYLDNTDDQKIDVFTFVGTTLSVSNEDDGEASKTVDLSSLVDNWLINGLDDVFGSTDIGDAETVTFAGTGGITAKLSFDGSNTMVIDGEGLQWILQAQSGPSQVIGDAASEIVEIVGAGNASTSISGNTVTITVPPDVDNYVDALTFSNSTFILTAGRTGALSDLTDTIMDHDWYKVGTALPPNNTEDARRNGLTGIGMDPVWLLDVAEDARIYGHQIGRGGGNSITNLRLGVDALSSNTAGTINIAIGPYSMKTNTTGDINIAIGDSSLYANDDGDINIAVGYKSLKSNISGYALTAFGHESLKANTTGYDNTAIGYSSQMSSTTGHHNTSLGHATLELNQTGANNIALGDYVLRDDIHPNDNIAIGQFAMNETDSAENNIAIGRFTLYNSTDPYYNIAIGDSAMYNVVTETEIEYNIAIGKNSMMNIQSVSKNNIAIGHNSFTNLDGDYNISLGNSNISTADSNVIIGYNQSLSTPGNLLLTNGTGSQFIRMLNTGFVGLGIAAPTQKLHVPGNVRVTGAYYDSNNEPGTAGQVLSSLAGAGTDWVDATSGGTMSYFFINGNDDAFGNTQVDQGEVITIDGTGGITASLAASGSLSYVIDGSGITGTTNLSITNSANPGLNSSNGSDVIFQDGTGINAVYVNDFTIRFDAADSDPGNEIQSLGWAGTGTMNLTLSGTSPGVYISNGPGISLAQVSNTMTISNTGDLLATNEGRLGVGTGGPTSSTIITNTTGSNAVTINVAGTLSIAESANSNGGSITITGTGGAGTVTSVGLTGTTGIGVSGTNPITGAGTFTLSLNNDLAALEALSGTGIAVRTGAATWTTRTIGAGPGISISNGDGVSANPSIQASVVNIVAGNNITVTPSAGTYTIAQPSFGSLTTGLTTSAIMYVDGLGTPDSDTDFGYNASTNSVDLNGLMNVDNLQIVTLPTYASDAAAASLPTGRVYKTATGELRIKL